jgi:uncharacterized protein involved in outer membrane biogenesis
MSKRMRKRVLWLAMLIVLAPPALYWAADTWLESSGGRQMLERALTQRIGMATRIDGDFSLMLLPAIGVSGTQLVIGEQPGGEAFVRSSQFEVSVALRPLWDRKVLVEWIRMTGGQLNPAHYQPSEDSRDSAGTPLPEIRELSLRDFEVVLSAESGGGARISELSVSDFAENSETPFFLDIEGLLKAEGRLRWNGAQSRLHLADLQIDAIGQRILGGACLSFNAPVSINAVLRADVFDLDAFQAGMPGSSAGGGAGPELPLEFNAQVSVKEFRSGGVTARGVQLDVGMDPVAVCGTD